MSTIIRKVKEKYLVEYYNDVNKLMYRIISINDIVDEDEYEIIKKRINNINKLIN